MRSVDLPGKLGRLTQGARSERPTKRRSGMVRVDGSLQVEVHWQRCRGRGDVRKIHVEARK